MTRGSLQLTKGELHFKDRPNWAVTVISIIINSQLMTVAGALPRLSFWPGSLPRTTSQLPKNTWRSRQCFHGDTIPMIFFFFWTSTSVNNMARKTKMETSFGIHFDVRVDMCTWHSQHNLSQRFVCYELMLCCYRSHIHFSSQLLRHYCKMGINDYIIRCIYIYIIV